MKIIDGKDAVLGRLASYVARNVIKGEDIIVLNCGEVLVTGGKKNLLDEFQKKRKRVGSGQKGPKVSKSSEKIVKKAIRGMLPNHRRGKGKEAYKRIKCYESVPEKFSESKKINIRTEKKFKFIRVKDIGK